MPDKFDTLRRDLEQAHASGTSFGIFGEGGHKYTLHPPLSEKIVSAFENKHKIRFPDDYRMFLTRIGNGGAGPYYGLFKFGEMDNGFDYGPWGDFVGKLSLPFPYADAWNDLTGKPDDELAETDEEKFEVLLDAFDQHYFRPINGAIPICHLGCALRQWVILTGPESGNVWCDDRADYKGFYPLRIGDRTRVSFFEWYRLWLDEVIEKKQASGK